MRSYTRLTALLTIALSLTWNTTSALAQSAIPFVLGDPTGSNLTLQLDPASGSIRAPGDVILSADYRVENTNTLQHIPKIMRANAGYPKGDAAQSWIYQGQLKPLTGGEPLQLDESLTRTSPTTAKFSIGVNRPDKSAPVYKLRWSIILPLEFANRVIVTDKQSYTLPKDHKEYAIGGGPVKYIDIPLDNGTLRISGAIKVLVSDGRAFRGNNYQLIIEAEAPPANEFARQIDVELSFQPYRFTTVSLAPATNMAFADEVAGDGKGGWTDQGKEQDLSAMPSGKRLFSTVPFDILDPKQNHDTSCIVFAGPQFPGGKTSPAALDITPAPFKTFFLLHAFAWSQKDGTELGQLVFTFNDGTTKEFSIQAGVDTSNWGLPTDVPNGRVVWTTKKSTGDSVGLSLSRFDLPGKPVKNVTLKGSGKVIWMIAGATGSLDSVPFASDLISKPLVFEENKTWKNYSFEKDVVPGSILDFSSNLDAPAGKYGFLQSRNGRLYFEKKPDQRVRLLGTNLVFAANYVDKPLAERLAKRLAAQGYNTVRIHHYDHQLLNQKPATSYDINAEQLDKLDYLIYCMKKEGLYISIDLYTSAPSRRANWPSSRSRSRRASRQPSPCLPPR